jgi:predicted AlkP superfamily pyrophosphatase or phosphodiesterase
VIFALYSSQSGRWETQGKCYRVPDYLRTLDARTLWEGTDGKWMGHSAASPEDVKRTAPFARFEADALVTMIEREPIGSDDVADLVLANLKVADYLGHAYGPDSAELREGITEMDRQIGRVLEAITRKAGPDGALVVITADHGMAAEPPPGRQRVYNDDVVKLIHARLDPEGKLVTHYGAENGQIYVDRDRARSLGVTMDRIRDLLQKEPYILAAFTEDEVRRVRLP